MRINNFVLILGLVMILFVNGCNNQNEDTNPQVLATPNPVEFDNEAFWIDNSEDVNKIVSCDEYDATATPSVIFSSEDEYVFGMSLLYYSDKNKENFTQDLVNDFIDKVNSYNNNNHKLVKYEEWVSEADSKPSKFVGSDSPSPEYIKYFFDNGDILIWNYRTWESTVISNG